MLKEELGVLDDPYRGLNPALEATLPLSKDHYQAAYDVAKASPILLKNDHVLPLVPEEDVVFVGSLLDEQNLLGAWAWHGEVQRTSSLAMVLRQRFSHRLIPTDTLDSTHLQTIQQAKKVVVFVGEQSKEFGEARSKVSPTLRLEHQHLLQTISKLNPNVITVVMAGRPLVLSPDILTSKALLYTFYLGSAMADVLVDTLFGVLNPSGVLPMTIASEVGQLPLHTLSLPTGRPFEGKTYTYTSHYIDGGNAPLFPFGFGLSYTTFSIVKVQKLHENEDQIDIDVTVHNTGKVEGEHPIMVYLQTPAVGVALPAYQLLAFKRVSLEAGMRQTITLTIEKKHAAYYDAAYKRHRMQGPFHLKIVLLNDQREVTF
jgi:beta-glucosidase